MQKVLAELFAQPQILQNLFTVLNYKQPISIQLEASSPTPNFLNRLFIVVNNLMLQRWGIVTVRYLHNIVF